MYQLNTTSHFDMAQTYFVTGANKGIGFDVARIIAEKGHKVLLGARDAERGKEAVAELKKAGLNVEFVQVDLGDSDSITKAVEYIQQHHGDLHALINNAGVPGDMHAGPSATKLKDLRSTIEVNVFGAFQLTQGLLDIIKKNKGTIVFVTTDMASLTWMATGVRQFNCFSYNVSKTAVDALTVGIGLELKGTGAQCFAVTPGFTTTDLNGNMAGGKSKIAAAEVITKPLFDGKDHNLEILYEGGIMPF